MESLEQACVTDAAEDEKVETSKGELVWVKASCRETGVAASRVELVGDMLVCEKGPLISHVCTCYTNGAEINEMGIKCDGAY